MTATRLAIVFCVVLLAAQTVGAGEKLEMFRDVSSKPIARASLLSGAGTFVPLLAGLAMYAKSTSNPGGDASNAYVLMSAGALLGPALGHLYLGDVERAGRGMGLRFLIGAAALLASSYESDRDDFITFQWFPLVAGAGVMMYQIGTDFRALGASSGSHGTRHPLSIWGATPYLRIDTGEIGMQMKLTM